MIAIEKRSWEFNQLLVAPSEGLLAPLGGHGPRLRKTVLDEHEETLMVLSMDTEMTLLTS